MLVRQCEEKEIRLLTCLLHSSRICRPRKYIICCIIYVRHWACIHDKDDCRRIYAGVTTAYFHVGFAVWYSCAADCERRIKIMLRAQTKIPIYWRYQNINEQRKRWSWRNEVRLTALQILPNRTHTSLIHWIHKNKYIYFVTASRIESKLLNPICLIELNI